MTVTKTIVEIAKPSDFEQIARFYDDVVEANSGTEYDVLWRRDLHPSDDSIMAAIQAGEHYAAWIGNEVVGAAVVNHDFAGGYEKQPWTVNATEDEALCIHLFAIHPNFQKRGIGKTMLYAIIERSKALGMKAIRLDVLDYNSPACKLYESVGFEFVSRTHLTYEDQDVCKLDFLMYEYAL